MGAGVSGNKGMDEDEEEADEDTAVPNCGEALFPVITTDPTMNDDDAAADDDDNDDEDDTETDPFTGVMSTARVNVFVAEDLARIATEPG